MFIIQLTKFKNMDPDNSEAANKPQENADQGEIIMTKPKIAKPHPFKYISFHIMSKSIKLQAGKEYLYCTCGLADPQVKYFYKKSLFVTANAQKRSSNR